MAVLLPSFIALHHFDTGVMAGGDVTSTLKVASGDDSGMLFGLPWATKKS
jgi:hypothetical protein